MFLLSSYDCSESKDTSKSKGRKGAKNAATAAKVALMKLKLHAAGDKGLPQVVLNVKLYCNHICFCHYYIWGITSKTSHFFIILFAVFWFSRQRGHIFRFIFLKNPRTEASPCSSVLNGVWGKWWIMRLLWPV